MNVLSLFANCCDVLPLPSLRLATTAWPATAGRGGPGGGGPRWWWTRLVGGTRCGSQMENDQARIFDTADGQMAMATYPRRITAAMKQTTEAEINVEAMNKGQWRPAPRTRQMTEGKMATSPWKAKVRLEPRRSRWTGRGGQGTRWEERVGVGGTRWSQVSQWASRQAIAAQAGPGGPPPRPGQVLPEFYRPVSRPDRKAASASCKAAASPKLINRWAAILTDEQKGHNSRTINNADHGVKADRKARWWPKSWRSGPSPSALSKSH